MSKYLTPEELTEAIKPKSDQLNADDLLTGPITVTIKNVQHTRDTKQPIVIEIEGDRSLKPWKPCKTMGRIMSHIFSPDPADWIGEQVTLYRDPDAVFQGRIVGGIRISHLSKMSEPKTLSVTISRSKRAEVTIHPISPLSPEDAKFIIEATAELNAAESMELLAGYGVTLKTQSTAVQDALRPVYAKRLEALK